MVTEQQIFFFKVKELRKKIKIKNLSGITINKRKGSLEMVLHVVGDSDVRFQSTARKSLIDIFKLQYLNL